MAYFAKSHGLYGATLEEQVNAANEVYRREGLALVQKIPTPITPVAMRGGRITDAYFREKSTVDYIGAVQGIPVAFDAKETGEKSFPLGNVHAHQVAFMRDFRAQGGVAFLLVNFTRDGAAYLLPLEVLEEYLDGPRRSVPREAFSEEYRIRPSGQVALHWLPALAALLENQESPDE